MTWQALSAHGVQRFDSIEAIDAREAELERALSDLCLKISAETGNLLQSGLQRARALRSKPAEGGKSHYECVNQLIHYWYCCAGARFLLQSGACNIEMRPTAHDNQQDSNVESEDDPYDLEARHPILGQIVGEVFCVSEALWPQKMKETRAKLAKSQVSIRTVFYNIEVKPTYRPKMSDLAVFGIHAPGQRVDEIFCSYGKWSQLIVA